MNNRYQIMTEKFNWESFLDPYIQAVGELKIKLRGARKQYQKQNRHSPIEFVTGRVKPSESIKNKARLRGFTSENIAKMQDIADRKSTRLNSSHHSISYAVFCLKKKK